MSGRDIEGRLWSGYVDKKAVNDAVGKLKGELVEQGVDETGVRRLIQNQREIGYRLTLASDQIQIVD